MHWSVKFGVRFEVGNVQHHHDDLIKNKAKDDVELDANDGDVVDEWEEEAVVEGKLEVDRSERMGHEHREHVVVCFHNNAEQAVARAAGDMLRLLLLFQLGVATRVESVEEEDQVWTENLPPHKHSEHDADVGV